jgi:hypothetical protein
MALRIRKNGDILCAALHGKEEGDTYIPDDISEILTGCTDKAPVLTTDPEPIHSTHGKWWWAGSETKQYK